MAGAGGDSDVGKAIALSLDPGGGKGPLKPAAVEKVARPLLIYFASKVKN